MLDSIRSSGVKPQQSVAPAAGPKAPAAAPKAPAAAQDAYSPSAGEVKVVTYNTAIGNPDIKTNQADFLKLPFYQKAISGAADAPILALQEVGNKQRDAVKALERSGNFKAYSLGVGIGGKQNDMVVIPKRYEVVKQESKHFSLFQQIKKGAGEGLKGLWKWATGGFKGKPSFTQVVEPRGYQKLELKDTVTGKTFTLFNAHTSFMEPMRSQHLSELMKMAHEAEKKGPVIVAGDLNTRTAECDPSGNDKGAREKLNGYADQGPKGQPADKPNIDYVLTKGFDGVDSKWYTGDSISLPGSPDASKVSDHYAEEDTIKFK
jgi:endonuclease/exonuclease/phosphatase family metal-dependent hydrolase